MGEHKRRKASPFAMRDGARVMVMRPETPEKAQLAIRIAEECAKTNDVARLANLPDEVGWPYIFIGYLAQGPSGSVLDERGSVVGKVVAGDSFMRSNQDAGVLN